MPSVREALLRARRLARRGDRDGARRAYFAVLERFPGQAGAVEGLRALEPAAAGDGLPASLLARLRPVRAAAAAGRLDKALEQTAALAEAHPEVGFVHLVRGELAVRTGRATEALAAFDAALAVDPEMTEAMIKRGDVLADAGRHAEAMDAFARALRLRPGAQEVYQRLARALRAEGRPGESAGVLRQALLIVPDDPRLLLELAASQDDARRWTEALEAARRARVLAAQDPVVQNEVGRRLLSLGAPHEAIEALSIAVAAAPDDPGIANDLGRANRAAGHLDRALAWLEQAHRLEPGNPEHLRNLAAVHHEGGDRAGALETLAAALALEPDHPGALRMMTAVRRLPADDPVVARMERLLKQGSLPGPQRAHLHFGLGKVYDEAGRHGEAFRHFLRGNRLRQEELGYDRTRDGRLFHAVRSLFDGSWNTDLPAAARATPLPAIPIFVVGMPRSGTTLTEQILASHSAVTGAGELDLLNDICNRLLRRIRADDPVPLRAEHLDEVRSAYRQGLARIGPTTPFVTDKMPTNFLWIGFIRQALPEARVVHVHRDAAATCWSIFTQYFSVRGNGYAYDLEDVAWFYRMYRETMAFWHARFPGAIFDLDYEALVREQAGETARLLAACGLPFEEACLSFHETERAVQTASAQQVRRKLYAGSSQRWRAYEPWLGPMLAILEGEGSLSAGVAGPAHGAPAPPPRTEADRRSPATHPASPERADARA